MIEEELTQEDYSNYNPLNGKMVRKRKPKISREELEYLVENSRIVVLECEDLVKKWTAKEQYFKANEARVAGTIHRNFIERLTRVLKGEPAFPVEVIDDTAYHII